MNRRARVLVLALLTAFGCSADPRQSTPESSHGGAEGDLPEGKFDGVDAEHQAPRWLLSSHGAGTWADPEFDGVMRGWVDARVKHRRLDKRVWVEVAVPYDNGAIMRTLHPVSYKGKLDSGYEKWGTDSIEFYPDGGPHGAHLDGSVIYRLRMQEDPDGDGRDQVVVTGWSKLFGEEPAWEPSRDPWMPGRTAPVDPVESPSEPHVYFTPFDDAGLAVIEQIDRVIEAKKAQPERHHTINAAVFNINDSRIVDRLIAAHQAKVDVRLITEATKFRPSSTWQTEDDRLLEAGVPLLGVRREGRGAMHDKFALFDGVRVSTGSFNWERGSSSENHENMILTDEPDLVAAYAQRFEIISGEVQGPRVAAADHRATRSVSFAPDEQPYRIAGWMIDEARASIDLAMFTCKDVPYEENGVQTSLFEKLVAAVDRGVKVTLVTDFGIAEASEYHGRVSDDDPQDEWLEDRGVHVVRADNPFGKYASMHHKFAVIDGEVLITGAFNWYWDAAYLNDEDQLLWRERTVAADYAGEFTDLLRRYDPLYDPGTRPQVEVRVSVEHAGTNVGDTVYLVGDLEELGAWDPARGLELDPSAWPTWTGSVTLPAGTRAKLKCVVVHANGSVSWQSGANRTYRVPTGQDEAELTLVY